PRLSSQGFTAPSCAPGDAAFSPCSWHRGRAGFLLPIGENAREDEAAWAKLRTLYGRGRQAWSRPLGERPKVSGLQRKDGNVPEGRAAVDGSAFVGMKLHPSLY